MPTRPALTRDPPPAGRYNRPPDQPMPQRYWRAGAVRRRRPGCGTSLEVRSASKAFDPNGPWFSPGTGYGLLWDKRACPDETEEALGGGVRISARSKGRPAVLPMYRGATLVLCHCES